MLSILCVCFLRYTSGLCLSRVSIRIPYWAKSCQTGLLSREDSYPERTVMGIGPIPLIYALREIFSASDGSSTVYSGPFSSAFSSLSTCGLLVDVSFLCFNSFWIGFNASALRSNGSQPRAACAYFVFLRVLGRVFWALRAFNHFSLNSAISPNLKISHFYGYFAFWTVFCENWTLGSPPKPPPA